MTPKRHPRPGTGHKKPLTELVEVAIANDMANSEIMKQYGISYVGLKRIKERMANNSDVLYRRRCAFCNEPVRKVQNQRAWRDSEGFLSCDSSPSGAHVGMRDDAA